MTNTIQLSLIIPEDMSGLRIDQALARLLPDYSRTQIQGWIKEGQIKLNDHTVKTKSTVAPNDTISIHAHYKQQPTHEAQAIALDIVYEDDAILVINKPAGMVVHPAAGNPNNTLLNALLHHHPDLQQLPRAGIIHRLDKSTTGLLIIAKTPIALRRLTKQLKARLISRIYQTVVSGVMISGGTIDAPIGRHPTQRKRMAVTDQGKCAVTHYRIIERFHHYSLLKVQLETGRTHQIRVHMAHIHHPIVGDPVYGGRLHIPKGASEELIHMLRNFKRQALHAYELSISHPLTEGLMTWRAPLPDDFQALLKVLREDTQKP